jgi:hypothetical protein
LTIRGDTRTIALAEIPIKEFPVAQKVQVTLVDDIDGSEASQTVKFGLDGREYEIDLNEKHADKLRKSMAAYVDSARRAGGRKVRGAGAAAAAGPVGKEQNQAIREWARKQGLKVSDRGRIPAELVVKFQEAHA